MTSPSTSPSTFDEIGPPAGSPDALAQWRDVLARVAALEPRERAELDLQLVSVRGDVWALELGRPPGERTYDEDREISRRAHEVERLGG